MIRIAAQLGPARQKNETATIGGDPRRSRSVDKGWRRLGVGSALIQGQIYGRRSRGLLLSLRATHDQGLSAARSGAGDASARGGPDRARTADASVGTAFAVALLPADANARRNSARPLRIEITRRQILKLCVRRVEILPNDRSRNGQRENQKPLENANLTSLRWNP